MYSFQGIGVDKTLMHKFVWIFNFAQNYGINDEYKQGLPWQFQTNLFKQWKLEAVESDVEINAFGNMLKGITNFQNPSELFQIFGSLYVTFPWKTL